jgi:hypothetical protein
MGEIPGEARATPQQHGDKRGLKSGNTLALWSGMRLWRPWRTALPILLAGGLATFALSCERHENGPSPIPCSYVLSGASLTFDAAGGERGLSVATEERCEWSATTAASWLSIASGTGRAGNGTVTVSAAPNPDGSTRTAAIAIAGHTVAVTQAGLEACSYEIEPTAAAVGRHGGAGSFGVRTAPHCSWTASSAAGWLHITSGSNGTGNGTVSYAADETTQAQPRQATILVADQTFTLTQDGDPSECSYSVAPVTFAACMQWPGELTSLVATQAGCPWTAEADVPWITITRGHSVEGSGEVRFTGTDNYDLPRTGHVKVRWPAPTQGQNIEIRQAGCTYWVSTTAIGIGAGGGSASFDVLQQSNPISCGGPLQNGCVWTAAADVPWITVITSMPQKGDAKVSLAVAANPGPVSRSGTVRVRDQIVHITQAGS